MRRAGTVPSQLIIQASWGKRTGDSSPFPCTAHGTAAPTTTGTAPAGGLKNWRARHIMRGRLTQYGTLLWHMCSPHFQEPPPVLLPAVCVCVCARFTNKQVQMLLLSLLSHAEGISAGEDGHGWMDTLVEGLQNPTGLFVSGKPHQGHLTRLVKPGPCTIHVSIITST